MSAEAAFALPVCEQLREQIRAEKMHGHLAVVFGAVAAALEINAGQATRLFLYIALRGMLSSGVRLNLVGPLQAQAMQYRLGPFAEELAGKTETSLICRNGPEAGTDAQRWSSHESEIPPFSHRPALTAPLIELFQATQDRLYSRLFQS